MDDGTLADLLTEALLTADVPAACVITRDVVSGSPYDPVLTPVNYAAMGWRDEYTAEDRRDATILVTDVKVYVVNAAPLAIAPGPADRITVNSKTYSIIRVDLDAAGACWIAQCRA